MERRKKQKFTWDMNFKVWGIIVAVIIVVLVLGILFFMTPKD